jgi:hypothetical protein
MIASDGKIAGAADTPVVFFRERLARAGLPNTLPAGCLTRGGSAEEATALIGARPKGTALDGA